MTTFLHKLSAFLFYILAGSFFLAWILVRNGIASPWPSMWLQLADLPLALVAVLYGGLSFYFSLRGSERRSGVLAVVIAAPLLALFIFLVTLNFWDVIAR